MLSLSLCRQGFIIIIAYYWTSITMQVSLEVQLRSKWELGYSCEGSICEKVDPTFCHWGHWCKLLLCGKIQRIQPWSPVHVYSQENLIVSDLKPWHVDILVTGIFHSQLFTGNPGHIKIIATIFCSVVLGDGAKQRESQNQSKNHISVKVL